MISPEENDLMPRVVRWTDTPKGKMYDALAKAMAAFLRLTPEDQEEVRKIATHLFEKRSDNGGAC